MKYQGPNCLLLCTAASEFMNIPSSYRLFCCPATPVLLIYFKNPFFVRFTLRSLLFYSTQCIVCIVKWLNAGKCFTRCERLWIFLKRSASFQPNQLQKSIFVYLMRMPPMTSPSLHVAIWCAWETGPVSLRQPAPLCKSSHRGGRSLVMCPLTIVTSDISAPQWLQGNCSAR